MKSGLICRKANLHAESAACRHGGDVTTTSALQQRAAASRSTIRRGGIVIVTAALPAWPPAAAYGGFVAARLGGLPLNFRSLSPRKSAHHHS